MVSSFEGLGFTYTSDEFHSYAWVEGWYESEDSATFRARGGRVSDSDTHGMGVFVKYKGQSRFVGFPTTGVSLQQALTSLRQAAKLGIPHQFL